MCTCVRVKAKDGSCVVARTMEFGIDPGSELTIFPRGFAFETQGANNKPGFAWSGQYGFCGMNMFGLPMVSDGVNECGLYVGDLYLPGFCGYQRVPAGSEAKSITPVDVAGYLLSLCSNVEDARRAIQDIYVWPWYADQIKCIPPLHFAVSDERGGSVVFEYVGGKLNIYDNPLGVLTNSPPFDWHQINLRNYINLSAVNVPELKLNGVNIDQLGQGSGMLGLPGDATPPSRYIRAAAFTQTALPVENSTEAVNLAYQIINNFDIPKGFARSEDGGVTHYDFTFWSTIVDLASKEYYYRGYENNKVFKVALDRVDLSGNEMKKLDTSSTDWFQEIS